MRLDVFLATKKGLLIVLVIAMLILALAIFGVSYIMA
jgi:hypothetical protein